MIALGIESTAHTLGVGLMDSEGNVLSNLSSVYSPPSGGIHPRDAAQSHAENAGGILEESLRKAELSSDQVDVVAFSQGPGLGPCLRTGAVISRAFSLKHKVPLYGVNHCVAHIEIGRVSSGCTDPVTLYVSGGNTQVIAFDGGRYRVFGESLDIAIGTCIDKFAREMGIGHPGGPEVERLAQKGSEYYPLPYSVKGLDVSFSGILSEAIRVYNEKKNGLSLEDMCFSLQETCFAMLTEITERALAHTEKREVLLCGGVAANSRLQEMLRIMSEEHDSEFFSPPRSLSGDNGAMIAWTGLIAAESGAPPLKIEDSQVLPKWRTDEVDVTWR